MKGQEVKGIELKRCPLCGNKAMMMRMPMTGMVGITCQCSSHVFYGAEKDEQKAAEMWNNRTEIDEDGAVIDG